VKVDWHDGGPSCLSARPRTAAVQSRSHQYVEHFRDETPGELVESTALFEATKAHLLLAQAE
jgi:hypothetical protein